MGTLTNIIPIKEHKSETPNIQISTQRIIVNGVDSIEVNDIQGVPLLKDSNGSLPVEYN